MGLSRSQLEFVEFESGGNRASHEAPRTQGLRALPDAGRHDELWFFAGGDVGAKKATGNAAVFLCRKRQTRAGIKVPDLGGVDAMPVGPFALPQQIVDGRRCRAAVRRARIAEGFTEIPALRMGTERQRLDDVL